MNRPAIAVSFEFFPPSSPAAERSLWSCIEHLAPLRPQFVSVTYGAGGTTRARTHRAVKRIQQETDLAPAAHLTCVDAPRAEIDAAVRAYLAIGVTHIVALRGDPPQRDKPFEPHPDGYAGSVELVAALSALGVREISVAAYPERHPEARSASADLDWLKRKIDAGATRAITQFFFDNDVYLRFVDRARAAGITIPIVPGILPITNFSRVAAFAATCGTSIPRLLRALFDGLDEDPELRESVAASVAIEQCQRLAGHGVREFHFYTLNKPALTRSVCHFLGVRPVTDGSAPRRVA